MCVSSHTKCVVPGSVDGHALQIDELKGTKPTEKIDLSGKGLFFGSAFIIASCIKENDVLKELKYAAHPSMLAALAPANVPALGVLLFQWWPLWWSLCRSGGAGGRRGRVVADASTVVSTTGCAYF